MKNHVTKERFLLEFFGMLGGRHLGAPKQFFVDNPNTIFEFIKDCNKNKQPAFISVQPMRAYHVLYGLEKIFYDFDYGKESDQLTPKQKTILWFHRDDVYPQWRLNCVKYAKIDRHIFYIPRVYIPKKS